MTSRYDSDGRTVYSGYDFNAAGPTDGKRSYTLAARRR